MWRFAAVGLLVATNAFFVATEFALVGVRRSKVEAMVREGVSGAPTLLKAVSDLDRYIAGTQVGITLASLALGWVGESALESVLHRIFHFLPPVFVDVGAPAITAFMIITFLHVVLGELVPKSIAIQFPEKTALRLAAPIRATVIVLNPLIWALNSCGAVFLRLLGLSAGGGGHDAMVHSVEELKILVEDSHKMGVLDEMERSILHRVFRIKDLVARQVMVHRLEMVGIPADMPYEGLMLAVVDAPYSRFPVYDGDIDHIIGILFVKDLIGFRRTPATEPFDLRTIVRPALFVPEGVPIETLLEQFRKARTQMAIVLDEFGGTSGMVTLEDVVEQLLGDLTTQSAGDDDELADAVLTLDQPLTVDGKTRLDVLNKKFGLALEEDDVDTIAGLVINRLGRMPHPGDEVEVEGIAVRVFETEGPRVTSLTLTRRPSDGNGASLEDPE